MSFFLIFMRFLSSAALATLLLAGAAATPRASAGDLTGAPSGLGPGHYQTLGT